MLFFKIINKMLCSSVLAESSYLCHIQDVGNVLLCTWGSSFVSDSCRNVVVRELLEEGEGENTLLDLGSTLKPAVAG